MATLMCKADWDSDVTFLLNNGVVQGLLAGLVVVRWTTIKLLAMILMLACSVLNTRACWLTILNEILVEIGFIEELRTT